MGRGQQHGVAGVRGQGQTMEGLPYGAKEPGNFLRPELGQRNQCGSLKRDGMGWHGRESWKTW